jgi:Reverse transcriptase (RNA-dependent DNA polymerase)
MWYYWYTFLLDPTNITYGWYAWVAVVLQVIGMRMFSLGLCARKFSGGLWWDKKYRVNWRCKTRHNYCKSFYSRSSKRTSRVCKKSASFNFNKTESRKSNFWLSERPKEARTRVHWRTRVRDILRHVIQFTGMRYMYCNVVQTSTNSYIGRDANQESQNNITCLPSTTEYDSDSTWVGIDSLSTYCITNDLEDFTETPKPIRREVRGIQSTPATITYVGQGAFSIVDDSGKNCKLQINSLYYCGSAPVKIISPQHIDKMWRNKNANNFFTATINSDGCSIQWRLDNQLHSKTITINRKTGLPICKTAPGYKRAASFYVANKKLLDDEVSMISNFVIRDEGNHDGIEPRVNENQHEMTELWFHDDNDKVQQLEDESSLDPTATMLYLHCKLGHLPFQTMRNMAKQGFLPRQIIKCREPKCASCMFGAATKRAWRTKTPINSIGNSNKVKKPGDCVSVDQFASPVPGLVSQVKGNPTVKRYGGGTVFVDHYSDATFVYFQQSLNAVETIMAKESYERWARSHGVDVKHYHADNGRFAENAFVKHVQDNNQTITFCGVNTHFQNGRAERKIRTLQDAARCQLVHAKMRWPQAAMKNVVDIMNDVCYKDNTKTRVEIFADTPVRPNLRHHHHFGVPVYVLDDDMQNGKKFSKWASRARIGIYLGKSPRHARSVGLVLNPRTGNVSPQFHIKYDDLFETVKGITNESFGMWKVKCGFGEQGSPMIKKGAKAKEQVDTIPTTPTMPENEDTEQQNSMADEPVETAVTQTNEVPVPATRTPTRRSTRAWKPSLKYLEGLESNEISLPIIDENEEVIKYTIEKETMIDNVHPMALLSRVDQDTMYWDQAMKAVDSHKFVDAAIKEVETHVENKHWCTIPLNEVPDGTKILDCVWSMKRKRRLKTNEVYKHKARLNIHGGQQELGVNYWETYAPVVTWAAIRLLLALSLVCGWKSKQIDFVLAYPQAPVECELYMKIPKGFNIEGVTSKTHALKILKNLYRQKQDGRVWNKHLHDNILQLGWTQSKADDCVYYKKDVIFCVYVDDGILFSPNENEIGECIKEFQAKFNISVEGDVSDYVGVNVESKDDGTIHMTQPQLINSIIKELNFLDSTKPAKTPAFSSTTLTAGKDKAEHKADWHYRRIIGKFNFLEKSCRPEIACAVHQAARFSTDPRSNHTEAVKRIVRYLKGDPEKGLIYKPNKHSFVVYADADFCGLWDKTSAEEDPTTAKSRTGYLVTYAGCPIIWASQLQPEIAQSVTESEYIALSQCLRQTIPLMRLVEELKGKFNLPMETIPEVRCKLFEDNSGAVELANVPKMRPRTKHINTKYHHFRAYVAKGMIKVLKIGTEEELADILTKNLREDLFLKFRKWICGW